MFYILSPHIALRSWWRVPYAFYFKGVRNAQGLSKEEFEFLSQCDGQTDLEDSPIARDMLLRGMIVPCECGAKKLDPWQKRDCDNRYFPAMNWMITGRCNYNCLHCFNAADNSRLQSEFSLEEAERLIAEAEKCGINAFTITGGEPMLHPHFLEILRRIYDRGMFVEELNTNGYFITQEILEAMKAMGCRPLIKISFDGLGHHDWLRNRQGAEADALRAIRLCVESGFRVKVQTNVHRHNVQSMLPTAQLLDGMGVDEMRIIRTTEVPRWNENAQGATLGLTEYYDRMLEFVEAYSRQDHRMSVDIWQFVTLFPEHWTYRLRPMECGQGEFRESIPVCRGNRGMVAVAANGNVFPCMQMSGYYEAHGDILGNVKTEGLQTLLQAGKYLAEVCTTLGQLAQVNPKCGGCKYYPYCAGGCRAIALTLTGDKLGTDLAKCLFFENGYYGKVEAVLADWRNLVPMPDLP